MGKGLTTVATVEADGSFLLHPVAAGDDRGAEVLLIEDLDSLKVKQAWAKVAPGGSAEITIGEPAGSVCYAVVTGRVTIGGDPVPGAFVVIATEGGNKGYVQTGADGTFRKEDIQPGKVRVAVWFGDPRAIDDFRAEGREPFPMDAGEVHRFDFELPAGAFRVSVVDDETGKPIPRALAVARPVDREAESDRFPGFRYHPGWGLRVGEDGSADLLAMPMGKEHSVLAMADGYGPVESTGHLPGTRDRPEEVTIRLKRK
jgi:hypothetical protein